MQGKEAKDVYKLVDVHMTDSVGHNKSPVGQIYCSSHTTLGFCSALNKRVSAIEADMKVE